MNEFYRLDISSFFDDEYAYNETAPAAKYGPKGSCPCCPLCGEPIGPLLWLEPRQVILSKPKYGDFVMGNKFLVSEGFKTAYESSDLVGIMQFRPVEVVKVRYKLVTSPAPPQYYAVDLSYSYARVDLKKSVIMGNPMQHHCVLCNPFSVTKDRIKGIYIDDAKWGGEDVFHLYEMGGSVYVSQKFIDFCLEHRFTNLKYINTKDYISLPYGYKE
jgi:hypothetical protein